MATQHSTKTLPFAPVEEVCNLAANNAQAISCVCTQLMGEHAAMEDERTFSQLMLIRTTADLIAGMMDHMIGGDMRGGLDAWIGLPEMGTQQAAQGDQSDSSNN